MLVDILQTIGVLVLLSIPIGVSAWAFLDAAARPRWVWAFAERRQVMWLCLIGFGVLTVLGGLVISGWYLARVRPALAAIEAGNLG